VHAVLFAVAFLIVNDLVARGPRTNTRRKPGHVNRSSGSELTSYFVSAVDRQSQRPRVSWRRHAGERAVRHLDRVDREVRAGEHDLEEVGDAARQAVPRHPRVAAIVALVAGTMREQSAEQVGLAASGAAFWLIISALPTAIAVVSLFGLAVSPERVASDLGTLATNAPSSLGALLTQQLRTVAASDHAGLSLGFAVSLVLAVWSASAGVWNLDRAIRVAYGLPPESCVEARARALLGALVVLIMLGLSAIATSIAEARSSGLFRILGIPVALLAVTVGVGALYRFAVGHPVAMAVVVSSGVVTVGCGVVARVSTISSATQSGVWLGSMWPQFGTKWRRVVGHASSVLRSAGVIPTSSSSPKTTSARTPDRQSRPASVPCL
jgi:uncharacterized BrkB/YihY/UPF0761 family membrane protein